MASFNAGSSKYGIKVRFKIDRQNAVRLEAYLDHLGISLETFIRRLVKKELLEETMMYPYDQTTIQTDPDP